jgi:hypothetical protein
MGVLDALLRVRRAFRFPLPGIPDCGLATAVKRGRSYFFILLVSLSPALLALSLRADRHKDQPVGFSVTLPVAVERLREVVLAVSKDGTIRGTVQYAKDEAITGAETAPKSSVFPAAGVPGDVFFKVKREALAPSHFLQSEDIGVVTVRYVVAPAGEGKSRLMIDAVFIEDGRRKAHFSDGAVEAAEFAAIKQRLDDLAQQEAQASQQARREAEEKEMAELTAELEREKSQLARGQKEKEELQHRADELRRGTLARSKSQGVPVKAAPYNHAPTLVPLAKGEEVTILERTPYWFRVRSSQGQQGWVYYLLLESGK